MDHRAFGIDVDTSMIWGRIRFNSGPKRKGVRTTNKMTTSEFVVEVHQRAIEHEAFKKAEEGPLVAKNGETVEMTGLLLDEAD